MTSFFSEEIWYAMQLSIITAVISPLICLIIAIPIAYSMTRFQFFREDSRSDVLLRYAPTHLPPLVAGVALLIFLSQSYITGGSVFHQSGDID